MSATEALDAYLERQLSSKTASSSIRAASKPQDQLKAAINPQARPSKPSEGGSRLRNTSRGPLLKQGAAGDDERVKGGAIKAVWPPSPLNESDKRPLLAKSHPAASRTAQQKPSTPGSGDQADPLSKLKRLNSSRLRNTSGASPRLGAGSETAQSDHFAAALEKLRREQDGGKSSSRQHAKQQGARPADPAKAAAGGSNQDSPGLQRRARWDPLADTEDRLALQRLTHRAATLSGHTSPTKVQSSVGDDKERAEGAATFHSLSQSLFSASPAGSGKLHSKGQDCAQTQQAQTHQARESAQILSEVLSELRAAEERSQEQQQTAAAPSSLMQAAHNEASALGAVTAWYRDVQQKHVAAGLGDDPIIASILPGSSRKLKRGEAPANDKPQADSMAEDQGGPLLQALMASLPRVPEMPKKAPIKLPVIQAAASSPQAPVTAQDPPIDFAAHFSGLAEDMPRLHRDTFLQEESQAKSRASSAANSPPQPAQDAHQSILPILQGVADAMPVKSPAAAVLSPVIASFVVAQAPQHIPSSVGRDLEMLQQRWQGFYRPPPAKAPVPENQVPSGNAVPHHVMAGARLHQQSMRQQQHSSDLPHPHDEAMYGMPAHSQMTISPTARPAADAIEADLQRRPISAEDRAETGLQRRPISAQAPAVSPLSAVSPVVGTPVEYFAYSALPAADVTQRPIQETADGSGFSYQAARSPGQQMLGKPPGDMPHAPYSHSSIRRLWGHPELKVGSPEPWAAGQGRLGPSWAERDRIASAMLQSQPRSSPANLSDVHMPYHSLAPHQVYNYSRHAHALTEANVSHSAADYDGLALPGVFSRHSRSSMGSGISYRSRDPSVAPPGTASSMGCASNASHRAGILDALLADADEVEVHDMHVLPGGLGMLSHEQYDGSSELLQLGLDAEVADLGSDVAPSRPGSSRMSLVAHYVQRGREAQRATSGQCRVPTTWL